MDLWQRDSRNRLSHILHPRSPLSLEDPTRYRGWDSGLFIPHMAIEV
jgi:hypothetical protein